MKLKKSSSINFFLFLIILFSSCSKNDEVSQEKIKQYIPLDNLSEGQGLFGYSYNLTSVNKILDVYYYIPEGKTATTPIIFVFHGAERNAEDYRNTMIAKADEFGFIIIAPEFSEQNYPGGDGYNLGNVFIDSDNPSQATLNPENEWAFSIVEPLFDYVKAQINNTNSTYNIFGHSAGGQFAHRFIMFKPNARINKVVASASGWYTFPNLSIDFPYGFNASPLEDVSLNNLLSKQVYIQVGENDNNPNAAGLRHNVFADAQGLNRKDRAINFFQFCQQLSQDNAIFFNWSFNSIDNADHGYILASENAANLLFN